jgi:hypothetical protein
MTHSIRIQVANEVPAPAPSCANAENAYRIAPSADALSAYSIARLVLATGCGIHDVVRNVNAGTWICPQFGVLCAHIASAA